MSVILIFDISLFEDICRECEWFVILNDLFEVPLILYDSIVIVINI